VRSLAPVLAAALLALVPASPAAAVVSQGAFRMGADALWSRGVQGGGEQVAIIDQGFAGLDAAIAAGELPPRSEMRAVSFDARHGLDGRDELDLPTEHGTRMAEIVHDVAPRARLVLVNYNTVAEFARAAEWAAAEGIPVVSHSNSFLDGPFDGTGPAARAVDAAAARGVLWVNSAGNFAQRHWAGRTGPADVGVPFDVGPAGAWLALHLTRRDAAADAGFVVERREPDGTWSVRATARPSGPVSVAVPPMRAEGGTWRVRILPAAVHTDVELFSLTVGFGDLAVPEGSVPTPADAAGALAVAAVPWTGEAVAPYSSRGPAEDGRAVPALAAPTYVTSNPAYPGTAGTSAATAHAAGAAALLREERRRAGLPHDAASLRQVLVASARDVDAPGPDAATGAGLLRLDVTPPRVRLLRVRARGRLVVRARDDGTLDRVEVEVPGVRTIRARRAELGVGLRGLPRRVRAVTVTARDMAGNTWRRRVAVAARP